MEQSETSDLGRMLKERRVTMGLTLGELSAKARVSASHLGRIERGERFPSAHALRKLSRPLGFEEPELLALGGFLSTDQAKVRPETIGTRKLDPYVAMVLSQEPVEVQRAAVVVVAVLKGMARGLLPGSDNNSGVKVEQSNKS